MTPPCLTSPLGAYLLKIAERENFALNPEKKILLVMKNELNAQYQAQLASFWLPQVRTLYLPEMDTSPLEPLAPNKSILAQRMRGFYELLSNPPQLLIVSLRTFCERIAPLSFFKRQGKTWTQGASAPFEHLVGCLTALGYTRVETVVSYGEFAVRGDILDIYTPTNEQPLRLDFLGDTLERISLFDPLSQRRLADQSACTILPLTLALITEHTASAFQQNLEKISDSSSMAPLLTRLKAGQSLLGIENALPFLFEEECPPLWDLYKPTHLYTDGALNPLLSTFHQELETGLAHLGQPTSAYGTLMGRVPLSKRFVFEAPLSYPPVGLTPYGGATSETTTFKELCPLVQEGSTTQHRFDLFLNRLKTHLLEKKQVILTCHTPISLERISHLLEAKGLSQEQVRLMEAPLDAGFEGPEAVYYTEKDIFGAKISRGTPKKRTSEAIFRELSHFQPGEYIVHKDHGIGQYQGLELVNIGGSSHDCLKLTYAGDDRLFLPVENIDLVSRYGTVEGHLACDKLGAAHWQNRQARIKKKIQEIAGKLIATAAQRQVEAGEVFEPATGAFDAFCASFAYAETEDQLGAIEDVLSDLQAGKPMDRLICGDVGFGKTEVALRAAFIVALTGAQVAVIVPTTLLARQHGLNFKSRLEPFGLKVATLSRLNTPKESKETLEGLSSGRLNVVIATHAIFSKNVSFSHLGMMIIDEEHHFGVAQKERLKAAYPHVHILTMTATPIPRTLHMALSGVRQMSLIATPPVDRLAVKTYLCPFDGMTVREAILRELSRQGQVFYISPRLEDLEKIQIMLADLLPEATLRIAHGQMSPKDLESVMAAFYNREFHILLATSIVESGIDLPWANTIFIHRADLFGMAQLYQLRGRVGRSQTQGYAYLLLPPYELSPKAMRRLSILESLDSLGAGFTLASHDMDIRGVGNLVGSEQSGHIREVGVELYQAMLGDAIQAQLSAAGAPQAPSSLTGLSFSPQLNLGLPIAIPETYVADTGLRLSLYRRAGTCQDKAAIEDFAAELIDRFGPLPCEVQNFIETLRLKSLCLKARVSKIDVGAKGALISFHKDHFDNVPGLLAWIEEQRGLVRLRPDHKISLSYAWPPDESRLQGLREIVAQLASLVTQ